MIATVALEVVLAYTVPASKVHWVQAFPAIRYSSDLATSHFEDIVYRAEKLPITCHFQ